MERILYEKIPVPVARQWMTNGRVEPERPQNVSVMFANVHRLMLTTQDMTPEQLVELLNSAFSAIDALLGRAEHENIHKLETIGDQYLVASGLLKPCEDHVAQLALFALRMRQLIWKFRVPFKPEYRLQMRFGLHCG